MSVQNDPLKDTPNALKPVYRMARANSPVSLYEGAVKLHCDDTVLTGQGSVQVDWSPRPRVCFKAEFDQATRIDLEPAKMELVDEWPNELIDVEVLSTSLFSVQKPTPASGEIKRWRYNPHVEVQKIIFHVPNLKRYRGEVIRDGLSAWAGRAETTFGEWKIVIDEIPDEELSKELKATGGFAITHVGCLVRQDGERFSPADAEECLNGLHPFLSFCCGRWTGPALSVGYDNESSPLFHEWGMPRISPYRAVRGWLSDLHRNVVSNVYPGFAGRWSNETWTQAIKDAIYWYIFGNAPGVAIENGVILAHVAFETLGWILFVEDTKALSIDGYKRLEAADKLRLLLNHCCIGLDVPSELRSLGKAAKAENWNDGPGSIAAVRNAHVHPSLKNRARLSRAGSEAAYEAWLLSMHYLELILLHLFDYHGKFSSRLISGVYKGQEVMPVPWGS